ncbi:cyclic nucleotide-binding domain-containing protein [Rhodospirillum sp. A1_3_36]|uniref:cyclic nucleotide-binding domain-containing protein n=1 Tax=Rhodospirillum sp. A1_3_36 TaxID=3391666 RepID=UPI0039A45EF0
MRKVLYILGQLNDRDIDWMVRHGRRQRFGEGQILITEGEPSDFLYILLEGELSIRVNGVGIVAERGVGEIVGEMSFVDSQPPSATVSAKGEALVLSLNKEEMREELRDNTDFASRFYRALAIFLSDRLRQSNTQRSVDQSGHLGEARLLDDELDLTVLDRVSQAGESFNRMIRRLSEA